MTSDILHRAWAAGILLAAGLFSAAMTSCSNSPRLVDTHGSYATNSSSDGGYNPYPAGGGGYATNSGSLLPSGTTPHYAEAPPPPPAGYEMPAKTYTPPSVPGSSGSSSSKPKPKSSSSSAPVKRSTTTASASKSGSKSGSKGTAKKSTSSSGGSYTVVKGDSLYAIAIRKHTTVAKLKSANGLSSDFLKIGQKLKIP